MTTAAYTLALAAQYHQAGHLQAAEQLCRQILAVEPDHADALHLVGVIAYQTRRHDVAIECLRRAIGSKRTDPAFHYNLACVFIAERRLDEAIACCRRALELKPDFAEVHNNLGSALREQGKLDEAVAHYRRALELNPHYATACANLGRAFRDQGKLDEAVASYRRALTLRTDWPEPLYHLGLVLAEQGKYPEAAACFRRATQLKPDYAEAYDSLGLALQRSGTLDQALACHRRALELNPNYAVAHNSLGLALLTRGHLAAAAASFRRAIELAPDFAGAYNNLGLALYGLGKLAEAAACHRRAIELEPELAAAHINLGNACVAQGRLEEGLACYRRAAELKPLDPRARSACLFMTQYRSSVTLRELADAHAAFERDLAAPLRAAWRPHPNVRDPERRLRLGFVSPDLHRHPVGLFLIPLLENVDHVQFEPMCYHDGPTHDDVTARLRAAATAWTDMPGLTDEQLSERIRSDGVDVLFDLSGHTGRNRLLVFARKPAPIQITWMGYEGTTGLAAMDYILADRYEIPPRGQVSPRLASGLGEIGPHCEAYYSERVLRMPDGYVCYDPPAGAPLVSPLPALEKGNVTFAAFHNPRKITPEVVAVWARVLGRLPRSRLVLKYRWMDDPSVAGRIGDLFAGRGVDRARLEFAPPSDYPEHFAAYRDVDIALDPFPFAGGITTCDALWMGVPVVTCPGETFASRHGLSHLANVGLMELVARDFDEYVQLTVTLANDLLRLAALRSGLRERMASSPLCDGKRFAANFAAILRGVWREWCERGL